MVVIRIGIFLGVIVFRGIILRRVRLLFLFVGIGLARLRLALLSTLLCLIHPLLTWGLLLSLLTFVSLLLFLVVRLSLRLESTMAALDYVALDTTVEASVGEVFVEDLLLELDAIIAD